MKYKKSDVVIVKHGSFFLRGVVVEVRRKFFIKQYKILLLTDYDKPLESHWHWFWDIVGLVQYGQTQKDFK